MIPVSSTISELFFKKKHIYQKSYYCIYLYNHLHNFNITNIFYDTEGTEPNTRKKLEGYTPKKCQ